MRAKLGQHFLINRSIIQRIIQSLVTQAGETIIEIGPGNGALTIPLAKNCVANNCNVIAIEKDKDLYAQLIGRSLPNSQLVRGDAIEELAKITEQITTPYKIVGNIPYYITGKLLRAISELKVKPTLSVLMIQREVGERLSAQPPEMNLLAAATQIWAKPRVVARLEPKDFSPPPKVHSVVIALETKTNLPTSAELKKYYECVRILFKQPRKTILNNLRSALEIPKNELESILEKLNIDPLARPQTLSVPTIKQLSELLT